MLIKINDKNEIVEMAIYGGLENGFEFEGKIPEDFKINFKPSFYLLKNSEIVENPNYEEPTVVDMGPSEAQKQLAQVTYQQMMTTQDVTALQTHNAQMAYQLMMMQKQGGEA